MDTKDINASSRTQSRPRDGKHPNRRHPHAGLVHDNTRHTARFTVIGNHLAQHPDLSLLAIGLGTHIQSLPAGAPISIKALTGRFVEGADRIASGLRELEAHGYLRRERHQIQGGRIVTRTVSCNQPGRTNRAGHKGSSAPCGEEHAGGDHGTQGNTGPDEGSRGHSDGSGHGEGSRKGYRVGHINDNTPGSQPHCVQAHDTPDHSPCRPPSQQPRKKALPSVPQPSCTTPGIFQKASEVLADLRRHDPRLYLSAADIAHLAPGVAAWLEREISPRTVRRVLAENLPLDPLYRPAAFVAHRLTVLLPPVPYLGAGRPVLPVYTAPDAPPTIGADSLVPVQPVQPPLPPGLRNPTACPECERPYRRPTPPGTLCLDCRPPETADRLSA
ncbi:helix-turn-helix domain-containing protein [Streptomyces niveiscabiei]|uniref:Helix-turn-helix domain-containing protein n=1 Tax=Streptomyces niveiscabiei TaxID=164115 RepID=A0ABW9HMS0_9ACTN